VILTALSTIHGILGGPAPYVLVTSYGGSSVEMEVRFWIQPPQRTDYLQMRDAALQAIKPALSAEGIHLPYPIRQLILNDQPATIEAGRKLSAPDFLPKNEK
ncbi:MAG: mechanosensitive ion channel family protein, partial [Proteobacteria bacterium]